MHAHFFQAAGRAAAHVGPAGSGGTIAFVVVTALVGLALIFLIVFWVGPQDGADGDNGGGGRGGGGGGGRGPKPDPGPSWWPEFERQFAEYNKRKDALV